MNSDWIFTVLLATALAAICFIAGAIAGSESGKQQGYIQSIIDHKEGKPLKYVLQTNKDHTTTWVPNKEYMDE